MGTSSDVQLTKSQKKKINRMDEENPFEDRRGKLEDHRSTGKPKGGKGVNLADSGVWGFAKEMDEEQPQITPMK